ncbi:HEPN domain-containing protein [Mariniphaga sp.]|uniref:HEPN domain-containing protein n=1 Tax=Mariniphaga sp. TaxID=1954475 RepID=UPI003569EDFB
MRDNKSNIDVNKIVKHWIETSDDDFNTMLTLYNSKSYGWSLFLGHISTEKLLKALYVKKFKEHAPFTHNLYRLGELIGLEMSDEFSDWLDEITSFNLNARYDDYKKEFYSLCTPDYTQNWIEKIKIIRTWIKEML